MAKKNQVARNERERKRVHQVNHGFDVLRNRLQPKNHTKKWSKADTLREAVKYIQQLQLLLNTESQQPSVSSTTTDYPTTSSSSTPTDCFNHYNVKEEFSMYMPQNYHQAPPAPQTYTSSPTSSVSSSSFSPSQMCYQTHQYQYHHQ
uniref:BHLH domain-containing protein n=1 Tax=Caenorhabditis japonica TaxID=281687 RepID=A0A8R1HQK2_CAEJA